jgi:5-methylcytosine-specific restriction endonuclease McrA
MTNPTYLEHLAGEEWQVIKGDVMVRANYRCEQCGKPWGLEVHHKTYERLGKESLDDLTCLCRDCHRKLHGIA